MLGWEWADNLTEAIAMARSYMERNAEITMLDQPIIGLCNVSDQGSLDDTIFMTA